MKAPTSKRFNLDSQRLRSPLYPQRSESLNLMPLTYARADAVRIHGTGRLWQNWSAFRMMQAYKAAHPHAHPAKLCGSPLRAILCPQDVA